MRELRKDCSMTGDMTPDVRPDTRMVTDAEAAEWLSWLDGVAPKPQITVQGMLRAQLADRDRWMALAANEHIECFECATVAINGGQMKEHTCPVEQARKLLKEAHGE